MRSHMWVLLVSLLLTSWAFGTTSGRITSVIAADGKPLNTIFDRNASPRSGYGNTISGSSGLRRGEFVKSDRMALFSGQYASFKRPNLERISCDGDTVCAGHYVYTYPISGGCYKNACNVNNAEESVILAPWEYGAFDHYCSQYCCVTEYFCWNGDPNDGL